MSENALIPVKMTWQDTMALGEVLARSKRFSDVTSPDQAVVQVLAGRELGIGPISAMTGIYVIKGKVSVGANLMAQAVKRSVKYDYRVVELSDTVAEIAFFEQGVEIGRSRFDKADAAKAQTQNLDKFARNMLFARAMSNGVKWYCPDVFSTAVYTPEELGIPVDGEGEIINVTPTQVEKPAETTTQASPSNGQHWIDKVDSQGRQLRVRFWQWARDTLGLTDAEVYTALAVEHIHDFTGTMEDAKFKIEQWVAADAEHEVVSA